MEALCSRILQASAELGRGLAPVRRERAGAHLFDRAAAMSVDLNRHHTMAVQSLCRWRFISVKAPGDHRDAPRAPRACPCVHRRRSSRPARAKLRVPQCVNRWQISWKSVRSTGPR